MAISTGPFLISPTAIQLNTNDIVAYGNRGLIYGRKSDLDGAIADFSEVIRLNPKSPSAYNYRAMTFTQKGDLDKAISDYSASIELKDSNRLPWSWRNLRQKRRSRQRHRRLHPGHSTQPDQCAGL